MLCNRTYVIFSTVVDHFRDFYLSIVSQPHSLLFSEAWTLLVYLNSYKTNKIQTNLCSWDLSLGMRPNSLGLLIFSHDIFSLLLLQKYIMFVSLLKRECAWILESRWDIYISYRFTKPHLSYSL